MFGNSQWKAEIQNQIRHLELQIQELKKTETELKSQNHRLTQLVKNLGRKLISRLPISLESLEKSLNYDLIFAEEVEAWRQAAAGGIVLDLRLAHEFSKAAIQDSFNVPFDQLSYRLDSLPKDRPLLLICENGIKSVSASELLNQKGYNFLYVLKGGMNLYRQSGSPLVSSEPVDESFADAPIREAVV